MKLYWISFLLGLLSVGLWRESSSVWLEVLDSWEISHPFSSLSHHRFTITQHIDNIFSLKSLSLQLWKHTFNRLLVALAVFDLMFVCSTVPIHVFPLFEYNNRIFALLYSRCYNLYFFCIKNVVSEKRSLAEFYKFPKKSTLCSELSTKYPKNLIWMVSIFLL